MRSCAAASAASETRTPARQATSSAIAGMRRQKSTALWKAIAAIAAAAQAATVRTSRGTGSLQRSGRSITNSTKRKINGTATPPVEKPSSQSLCA